MILSEGSVKQLIGLLRGQFQTIGFFADFLVNCHNLLFVEAALNQHLLLIFPLYQNFKLVVLSFAQVSD